VKGCSVSHLENIDTHSKCIQSMIIVVVYVELNQCLVDVFLSHFGFA